VFEDTAGIIELAREENDGSLLDEALKDLERAEGELEKLEFRRMFDGEMDANNAYLDIQAGSGGTEAQDWAEILLRMYLRWAEKSGYKTELVEVSGGEVAGIKSATVHVQGEYAFGWLRTETGVHRLVRKSPFDSGNRRHTSFASVFVSPEVDDDIHIELDWSKIRVDTYRASGAGGQHVNKTDSAIRLTHEPSGIVVECQEERSQHQNKEKAMTMLRAKMYDMELEQKQKERAAERKSQVSTGDRSAKIRTYNYPQGRMTDHRINLTLYNLDNIMKGDIEEVIKALRVQDNLERIQAISEQ